MVLWIQAASCSSLLAGFFSTRKVSSEGLFTFLPPIFKSVTLTSTPCVSPYTTSIQSALWSLRHTTQVTLWFHATLSLFLNMKIWLLCAQPTQTLKLKKSTATSVNISHNILPWVPLGTDPSLWSSPVIPLLTCLPLEKRRKLVFPAQVNIHLTFLSATCRVMGTHTLAITYSQQLVKVLTRPQESFPDLAKVALPHFGRLPIAPLLPTLKTLIPLNFQYVEINKGKRKWIRDIEKLNSFPF